MMKLISELSLPPEKKSELVKGVFQTLANVLRDTLATSGSNMQRPGARPLSHMFMHKQDIKRLRRHGARICFLLKDWSGKRGRVWYWVSISIR